MVPIRKLICMVLCVALLFATTAVPAEAAEVDNTTPAIFMEGHISPFATGSFNMSIPARTKAIANSSFPLAAGETVTIKASYSPFSASVDFGLVAPDGKFYFFNITDGSIDETIQVSESGKYTLQIRNNSSSEIRVSGFVNY